MCAKLLAEAGASVLLLDAGGHNIDRDIRHHQWDWEFPYRNSYQSVDEEYAVSLPETVHTVGQGDREVLTVFDGSAHNNYRNDHFWAKRRDWKYTFPKDKPYRWVRVRALGGKTNCWAANTCRWGPKEFKPASYDGHDVDWPVSYQEMAPWYTKVERLIGVSGPQTNSEDYPSGDWLPPIAPRCGEVLLTKAAAKMGLNAFATPKAAITRNFNGRPACHYCGSCSYGCDSGSKFTTVGVLLPPAMSTGRLTILMNSIVREVLVDNSGRARGVSYVDRYTFRDGEALGKIVILAASAIETARIMLNSKSGRFPDGIANSSGQVGRNLVENPTASVHGYLPQLAGCEVTNDDGWATGRTIAPFINTNEKNRSKKFLRRFEFSFESGGIGSGGGHGGEIFGPSYKSDRKHWSGTSVSAGASGEGIWSPDNFVDLDPDVKDIWGIPAARIQMVFGENEKAMTREIVEWGVRLIEAAGGKVTGWQVSPSIPGGQIHEQGTCRMGDDPKKFVTNRWGQCHDVPNLMLADGSLHVTCSTDSPTLTILTMAMRNASHLAEIFRNGDLKT
jgi:choline dehydrogenase-like flavoprotein